jgi:hypothetical protein
VHTRCSAAEKGLNVPGPPPIVLTPKKLLRAAELQINAGALGANIREGL